MLSSKYFCLFLHSINYSNFFRGIRHFVENAVPLKRSHAPTLTQTKGGLKVSFYGINRRIMRAELKVVVIVVDGASFDEMSRAHLFSFFFFFESVANGMWKPLDFVFLNCLQNQFGGISSIFSYVRNQVVNRPFIIFEEKLFLCFEVLLS